MRIELAKVGIFGADGTPVTEVDLEDVAETFGGEVPITLGHTLADWMPAFGWVKGVEYDPEKKTLYGDIDLSDLLKDAFDAKLYKKWSVGIRHRANDGKCYLHHVAFLGAVPPKIRDLKILDGKMFMADVDETWTFDLADTSKPPALSSLEVVDRSWDVSEARKRVFEKYGIEGLKAYCLYRDPEADPENKTAYKFLVVDIVNDKPVIIAKALSAALAYLHGARGANIPEEVLRVVEPKVKRLLEKKKKEEAMKDNIKEKKEFADAIKPYEERLKDLEAKLKAEKKEALKQAIEGKLPKEKHGLVLELADRLSFEESIELADENGRKHKVSAIDLLIDIFKAIPLLVEPGQKNMGDLPKEEINYAELVKYV